MKLKKLKESWTLNGLQGKGATMLVEHGANPGIVSHLVKKALIDIANKTISDKLASPEVIEALNNLNFPKLAQALCIKTIHISERDTQISNQPKKINEFVIHGLQKVFKKKELHLLN